MVRFLHIDWHLEAGLAIVFAEDVPDWNITIAHSLFGGLDGELRWVTGVCPYSTTKGQYIYFPFPSSSDHPEQQEAPAPAAHEQGLIISSAKLGKACLPFDSEPGLNIVQVVLNLSRGDRPGKGRRRAPPRAKSTFFPLAYGREDAEKDAALLCAAGAALHPALGPILNPWGSMKAVPSPHSTYGFLVNSGWLAGGLK
ncbi:hypothetical protein C8J57DRAFT_1257950 [Mycena rebaudengoi]|nr:hypothetical protein C8J57DRAFT_1257950 [Mycena rebaudengoi]